jgi:hypothetical protein
MSRTKGRRAAKRQRQWSTSAWFRDPFATFSWPREAHIHRSRVSNSIGGAESHSYTLSRCRRAKAQGPSRVGNPRYLSLMRATAPAVSPWQQTQSATNEHHQQTTHCSRMYFGPCSAKNRGTPQQKKRCQYGQLWSRADCDSCETTRLQTRILSRFVSLASLAACRFCPSNGVNELSGFWR